MDTSILNTLGMIARQYGATEYMAAAKALQSRSFMIRPCHPLTCSHLLMPLLDVYALKLVSWEGLPDPHTLIPTTCGDVHAIWAPCHTLDFILMTLQYCHLSIGTTQHQEPSQHRETFTSRVHISHSDRQNPTCILSHSYKPNCYPTGCLASV